jgi:hypothetical protein
MPSRLVRMPSGGPLDGLARHMAGLVASGHWVLLVTARTPGATLLRELPARGVDPARFIVVDVVSLPETAPAGSGDRLLTIPSPALLELLALRGEKVVWSRRQGRTHIIVQDLNSFARYSPPAAIEQMARYVMQRVMPYTVVDFLLCPDLPVPKELVAAMSAFCDEDRTLDQVIGTGSSKGTTAPADKPPV